MGHEFPGVVWTHLLGFSCPLGDVVGFQLDLPGAQEQEQDEQGPDEDGSCEDTIE